MIRQDYILKISYLFFFALLASCEKEVSVTPPTEPVPISSIFIDSNPPGAKIYEDGRNSSRVTPDSLNWLEEKTYNFTLRKELFRDTSFLVTLQKDEKKEIFVDYFSNPSMLGKIKFITKPEGASIFLNEDSLELTTPAELGGLKPGRYTVTYKRKYCYPDSIEVTVSSNQLIDAVITLKDTTYWVDYKSSNSGLPNDLLRCIAVDKDNVIWLGTLDGIVKFDGLNWTHYHDGNSPLVDNEIQVIRVDEQNRKWIGTNDGLYVLDGSAWKRYTENPKQLPNKKVYEIYFAQSGEVYIGTANGIGIKSDNEWTHTLMYNSVRGIDIDLEGDIWAVTGGGGLREYIQVVGLWYSYYNDLEREKDRWYNCVKVTDEKIWFGHAPSVEHLGSTYGLTSIEHGVSKRRTNYPIYDGHWVYDIVLNGNEKWICSDKGIYVFETIPEDYKRYNFSNTLMERSIIRGVAFDSDGNAWVATENNGLYKFKYGLLKRNSFINDSL